MLGNFNSLVLDWFYWTSIVATVHQFGSTHPLTSLLVLIATIVYKFVIKSILSRFERQTTDLEEIEVVPEVQTEDSFFQTNCRVTHNYYGVIYQPTGRNKLAWSSENDRYNNLYVTGVKINPRQPHTITRYDVA